MLLSLVWLSFPGTQASGSSPAFYPLPASDSISTCGFLYGVLASPLVASMWPMSLNIDDGRMRCGTGCTNCDLSGWTVMPTKSNLADAPNNPDWVCHSGIDCPAWYRGAYQWQWQPQPPVSLLALMAASVIVAAAASWLHSWVCSWVCSWACSWVHSVGPAPPPSLTAMVPQAREQARQRGAGSRRAQLSPDFLCVLLALCDLATVVRASRCSSSPTCPAHNTDTNMECFVKGYSHFWGFNASPFYKFDFPGRGCTRS